MPIEGFNGEEFAKSIAQQAMAVLPGDFSEEHKSFVIQTIYKFCALAGNALSDDTTINYSAQEASIVTQFIGEWTFHKSVDIISSGIEQVHWEPVLQQVAFAVFEKAKEAITKKMDQDEGVAFIEAEVKLSYETAINQLVSEGNVQPEKAQAAISHSNIDNMAAQNTPQQSEVAMDEERKTYKLASMAIVLRDFSAEDTDYILNSLSPEDSNKIREFINMPDLDAKIDPELVNQYLNQFKYLLPSTKIELRKEHIIEGIMAIGDGNARKLIERISIFERPQVKGFIDSCINHDHIEKINKYNVNDQVGEVIYNYLRKKAVK